MGIQINAVVSYPINDEVERVLGLAEAVGEPVSVTFVREGGGEPEHTVLVPAATLARWEHWAPAADPANDAGGEHEGKYEDKYEGEYEDDSEGQDEGPAASEEPELAHPVEYGPFTLFRRRAGGRTAVARQGVVVAELLPPYEAHRLQEQARNVRQGFMDPKQRAAFEEFLARQPPVGEQ